MDSSVTMAKGSPHRVLIIAEACNPEWVSVPLVGWSHALAISKVSAAHLVTQVRNRDAIERFGWREGVEFTAIDSEKVSRALWAVSQAMRGGEGKGWTTVAAFKAPAYLYFERLFWQRFEAELRAGKFDLVHRITPLSPTTPSFLGKKLARLGIPLVVGPLNGGVAWPKEFDKERRAEREWLSYVRGAYRLLPGQRSIRRHATALVAGSSDTFGELRSVGDRLVYLPENAVDPERFVDVARPLRTDRPLRVAFVGRLVPYKAVDMLLEASADLVRAGRASLIIIGDGPERQKLEGLVDTLGMRAGVEFTGWLEHTAIQERLREADVLGFPSIREFGGGVVLEAMALGVVPVVVAYGGPKELVTAESGIALPLGSRPEIVARLAQALDGLASDPRRVADMARAARARVVGYFTWERKAEQSLAIYDWVLGRAPKPDFGMPLGQGQ